MGKDLNVQVQHKALSTPWRPLATTDLSTGREMPGKCCVHPKCWIPLLLPRGRKHGITQRCLHPFSLPRNPRWSLLPKGDHQELWVGLSWTEPLDSEFPGIRDRLSVPTWNSGRGKGRGAIEGKRVLGKQKGGWFGRAGVKLLFAKGKASPKNKLEFTHSWGFGRSREWEDGLMRR